MGGSVAGGPSEFASTLGLRGSERERGPADGLDVLALDADRPGGEAVDIVEPEHLGHRLDDLPVRQLARRQLRSQFGGQPQLMVSRSFQLIALLVRGFTQRLCVGIKLLKQDLGSRLIMKILLTSGLGI